MNGSTQDPVRTWAPAKLPDDGSAKDFAVELTEILSSGQLRDGHHTGALEEQVGGFFGRRAVAVGSGMDALELLLEACAVRGRRVLVPAHCFQAIPALVARLGGRPVALPVDPATLAPPRDVAAEDGTVLIWVHHAGIVADYAPAAIERLRRAGTTVIEDCAYVLPDSPRGPGSWGDAAVFSFAPTKPMSGFGGAVVITASERLADTVRARRTHSGVEDRWQHGDQLLRWRGMSEADALLASWRWRQRAAVADQLARVRARYRSHLLAERPELMPAGRTPSSTWGRYTADLDRFDAAAVQSALADRGIHTSIMAPAPWSDYPALSAYAPTEPIPLLRTLLRRTLALPHHPRMSEQDADRTCQALLAVLDAKETST